MRYDERTKQFVPTNPPGAPPVPDEVDNMSGQLTFYVSGIVETLTWLDSWLSKVAEAPGLQVPPKANLIEMLNRIEQLCRNGWKQDRRDYDVLDLVSLNNQAQVALRAHLITELTEAYMEAGRRQGQKK
jgi:hypothetical protein